MSFATLGAKTLNSLDLIQQLIDMSDDKPSDNRKDEEKPSVEHEFTYSSGGMSEIEEVQSSNGELSFDREHNLVPIKEDFEGSLYSFDSHNGEKNVYVCVGKSETSMDALAWTLKHCVDDPKSTFIYLIHVFPEIRSVPTPLGKLPKSQVSPEQVEGYMAQERGKRREFLQKFINLSFVSMVRVETMLIESDTVAKSILDLIPILRIKKLVLGASKSSLRKMKSGKGTGIADQIHKSAPEDCDVTIICEGKQVPVEQIISSVSPRADIDRKNSFNFGQQEKQQQPQQQQKDSSSSWGCFKPKF